MVRKPLSVQNEQALLETLDGFGWSRAFCDDAHHNDDCREIWTITSPQRPLQLTLYLHLFSVSGEHFDNPVSRIIVAMDKNEHWKWDYQFDEPMQLGDGVISYARDWTRETFRSSIVRILQDLDQFRNEQIRGFEPNAKV